MSSVRQICSAFISEYKNYRVNSLWNSIVQKVMSKFTTFYSDRKKECDNLIRDINAAVTLKDKLKIIDKAGQYARKAQELKQKAEEWHIPKWVLSFFRKESSLWAKTLHAVRTCFVADILNSSDKEDFLKDIAALKVELASYHTQISNNLDKHLKVDKLNEKRDEIYYKLLDRQDWETIKDAREHNRFPAALPSPEELHLPEEITIFEEIPAVYDNNYFTIFFLSEVHVKSGREIKFNELLKKYLDISKQNENPKPPTLLDEGFFNSPDFKEFLQANASPNNIFQISDKNKSQQDASKKDTAPNEKPDDANSKEDQGEQQQTTNTANTVNQNPPKDVSVTQFGMYSPNKKEEGDVSTQTISNGVTLEKIQPK